MILGRPLTSFILSDQIVFISSWKYLCDLGRLEQYMQHLRNFCPDVYLEDFQVQIRTALYDFGLEKY